MVLTNKLQADYAELANQYLDNIPVEREEDFEIIAEALRSITEPNQNHWTPPSLESRIKGIKELIDEPEMYVQNEEDYPEYKSIILDRVSAKISQFSENKLNEKERYIQDQKQIKEEALKSQEKLAQVPRRKSNTLTELEWMRDLQQQLNNLDYTINDNQIHSLNQIILQAQQNIEQVFQRMNRGNITITDMFDLQIARNHLEQVRWMINEIRNHNR